MHSELFYKIRNFYKKGLYSKDQVYKFVEKHKITEEEYIEIVGEE